MSQNDFVIDNASGLLFRLDVQTALQALASTNSGPAAPTTTYPLMLWADTANNLLKMRNSADDAWVTLCDLGVALARGDHTHPGTYEPADPDILKADVSAQLQVSFPVKAGDGAGSNESMPSGNFTVDWRAPDTRNFTLAGNATLYDEANANGNERAEYYITPGGYTLALNSTKFKKSTASGDWSTTDMNIVHLSRNGIDGIVTVFISQRAA